ncbi:MAG TPA: isopentenyl-diphosphate Delta-isomerase [Gemmatimonadaceae bacterium]
MHDDRDEVVLVDEHDREVGLAGKLDAHRAGQRHRAVSVFVFDDAGRLLLQRRSARKYHSAGRWANTCCSHPRPGETTEAAAQRRLREEMGIQCTLERAGRFTYRADVGGGLIEHEVDHLFVGRSGSDPSPDAGEVGAWRWARPDEIDRDLAERPEQYAAWFGGVLGAVRENLAGGFR